MTAPIDALAVEAEALAGRVREFARRAKRALFAHEIDPSIGGDRERLVYALNQIGDDGSAAAGGWGKVPPWWVEEAVLVADRLPRVMQTLRLIEEQSRFVEEGRDLTAAEAELVRSFRAATAGLDLGIRPHLSIVGEQ